MINLEYWHTTFLQNFHVLFDKSTGTHSNLSNFAGTLVPRVFSFSNMTEVGDYHGFKESPLR